MVQITHARIRDDNTGELVKIAAKDFDKKTDGKKVCHCPDKNCGAILSHVTSYQQNFYDPENREWYKLKIPAHFQRAKGSAPHHESCTAVDAYTIYQGYAREVGGLSQQNGAFVYNLNIMTDNRPAPIRRPRLAAAFGVAVPVRESNGSAATPNDAKERARLSIGLNHVDKLAGLLNKTEFDKHYRHSILLRDGIKRYTLADLFEDDTVRLFRTAHARAKAGAEAMPVLLQFKPIAIAEFHDKKARTFVGQATTMRGADGHNYSVSVMLHCGTEEIFKSMKQAIRAGERSFLLYAENARVDLLEFVQKKKDIHDGRAKDSAVLVHVRIDRPEQMTVWTPFNGQLDLEEAGMDLPIHRKPPRDIPQHLLG